MASPPKRGLGLAMLADAYGVLQGHARRTCLLVRGRVERGWRHGGEGGGILMARKYFGLLSKGVTVGISRTTDQYDGLAFLVQL